jgi:hypothetical protein
MPRPRSPGTGRGPGRPFLYFAYGVAVTEVVIDTLTGENRILRADILHDTGNSLNPALDIGQIEGAYVQGAGWLTTEELVWDDKGRLATHAPSPTRSRPVRTGRESSTSALWDRPNPEDTVGKSKAVGEPPFMLGISAFLALRMRWRSLRRWQHLSRPARTRRRPRRCWMPSAGCGAMFDLTALQGAVAAHGQVARLVIAGHDGSSPARGGAAMLVWAGGRKRHHRRRRAGVQAVARARSLLLAGGTRLDRIALGPALGQCCGGRGEPGDRDLRYGDGGRAAGAGGNCGPSRHPWARCRWPCAAC